MRITSKMMMDNSLYHINNNKLKYDELNTQLTTEQKIQRPSDDPIIAVRALRLRTTYSQITQYLERNIKDANAWMDSTEQALDSIEKVLGDITYYIEQGANGDLEEKDKATIANTLATYRDQLFATANADYAGRTIFTGYKTDRQLTFVKDDPNAKFTMTQNFKYDNIRKETRISNALDISQVSAANISTLNVSSIANPEYNELYVVRLGYEKLDAGTPSVDIYKDDGTGNIVLADTVMTVAKSASDPDAFAPGDNDAYFIAETGEIVMGKNVYAKFEDCDRFETTYSKTGFKSGDLNPIHYFDCTDNTDLANPIVYTSENQKIEYEVSFNQNMHINLQGKDVFQHDMTRDIDELADTVNFAMTAQDKVNKIQTMYDSSTNASDKKKLEELLNIANQELDYATDRMNKMFSAGLTKYHNHQTTVANARADIGARQMRLELTETRLTAQQLTVRNLKSTNEEVNTVNIAVQMKEASSVYDASLAAAAKLVQKSLLDFL